MSDEEILDVAPRRIPRWAVAGTAVLVAIVVALLLARGASAPPPRLPAAAAPTTQTATHAPDVPFPVGTSMHDQLLAYIYQRANQSWFEPGYVRTDTSTTRCATVPNGIVPEARLASAVITLLPHMQPLDFARTRDKFDGLCVLDVRAADDTGSVLIVRIVAPLEDAPILEPRVDQGSVLAEGTYTRYVEVISRNGWIVTAGASGPADAGPSRHALLALAQQQTLHW